MVSLKFLSCQQLLTIHSNSQQEKLMNPTVEASLKSTISKVFQKKGYPQSKSIQQHTFFQLLDELLGQPFPEEIANGLWDQIELKSNEEASMDLICKVICEAQMSTYENVCEEELKIRNLEDRRKELPGDKKVKEEIEVLMKDLVQFRQDLDYLTKPFGVRLPLVEKNPEQALGSNKSEGEKSEQELQWAIETAMAIEQILM